MNGRLKTFERGTLNLPPRAELVAKLREMYPDAKDEELQCSAEDLERDEVWMNNEYQVNIDKTPVHAFGDAEIWHLSIKRRDKRSLHDWRDLQVIKNMLAGPEYEAIELYPSSQRVVDQANQYHLWVFIRIGTEHAPTVGVGWNTRVVADIGGRLDKSKQRGLHQNGASL